MSTKKIYLTGLCKWARCYESQMDTKYGEKFHITLYPDEVSLGVLEESGSRIKRKEDEDGVCFKFSRENLKEFKGNTEYLGPPVVLDADGETPFDKIIGNGSTVTLRLSVYDSKHGKGTRLDAVRVDVHVPFEPDSVESDYAF